MPYSSASMSPESVTVGRKTAENDRLAPESKDFGAFFKNNCENT